MIKKILQLNKEEFEKLCLVNKFGECKYFDPQAFGYKDDDTEFPVDKFFPESIKAFLSLAQTRLLKGVVEILESELEKSKHDGDKCLKPECAHNAFIEVLKKDLKALLIKEIEL